MTDTYKITKANQFFTENYINARCVITAAGADYPAYLYDNRAETAVTFTFATSAVFRVDFYDKYGTACTRVIDRLILQGVSGASAVDISYVNTSDATVSILSGEELAENNLISFPAAVTAKALILTFTAIGATFVIKQIRALAFVFDLGATSTTTLTENSDKGSLTTKAGDFYAWTKYLRRCLKIKVKNGSYAQYKTLKAAEAESEFLTVVPFEDLDFFCIEARAELEDAEISRITSLVDYTIKATAK